ncbi:hypothetical protein [Prevotella sp.]|uniref:hypothetical protein n=1 Tax=Prevotella sp. TaxID=59823 RepID=UPI002649D4EE|nr:hypothetical protein [Prevotella sp.]MDN5554418.1 hypothetical protein [Prevotella sp.]
MNIKKTYFVLGIMLTVFTNNALCEETEIISTTPIFLHVEEVDPFSHGPIIRMLRRSMSMTYSDHTINFDNVSSDYILSVIDDENRLVYTTLIPAGTKTCELPSMLKGAYTIKMTTASFTYSGEIDL